MNVSEYVRKVLLFVSETLFPADEKTRELETMSVGDFLNQVSVLKDGREMKGITILFEYHHPLINHAIRAVKFRGNILVSRLLAGALYENILEELGDKTKFEKFDSPLFIPVPSSDKRKNERGWNQCELVGHELALIDRGTNFILDTKTLSKNRFTESQIGKTRAERLANLADSFSVNNRKRVSGRNIILFDDVVTTGATMSEAKKTLLEAGARKVWCIALAH